MDTKDKRNIGATVWRGFQIFMAATYISGMLVALFIAYKAGWIAELGSAGLDYKDFVSILLTATALMLAVLGAILAILAVYGFQGIKEDAVKRAGRAAKKTAMPVASNIAKQTATDIATLVASKTAEEVATSVIANYFAQTTPENKEIDYGGVAGQDKDGENKSA
jgi:hypothetical protein